MPTTPSCHAGSKKLPWSSPDRPFNDSKACSSMSASILLPVAVQPVELLRAVRGARLVVGDQALDAEAHVGEAAGGVEARPGDEAEVEARGLGGIASGGAQQRGDAVLRRGRRAGA